MTELLKQKCTQFNKCERLPDREIRGRQSKAKEQCSERLWERQFYRPSAAFSIHIVSVLWGRTQRASVYSVKLNKTRPWIKDQEAKQGKVSGGMTQTISKQLSDYTSKPAGSHCLNTHAHSLALSHRHTHVGPQVSPMNMNVCASLSLSELLWGPLSKRQVYQSAACLSWLNKHANKTKKILFSELVCTSSGFREKSCCRQVKAAVGMIRILFFLNTTILFYRSKICFQAVYSSQSFVLRAGVLILDNVMVFRLKNFDKNNLTLRLI